MDARIAGGKARGFMNITQSIENASGARRTKEDSRQSLPGLYGGGDNDCGSPPGRILPFENGRCLPSHRVLANDLTPKECDHIEDCQHCQDAFVSLGEATEPRLRRLYRHLRLTLYDWNPVLQFFTLLVILAAIGWGVYQVRMVAKTTDRAIAVPHELPAPPTKAPGGNPGYEIASSKAILAQQVAAIPRWPWSTCAVSADAVNQWLGHTLRKSWLNDRDIDRDRTKATHLFECMQKFGIAAFVATRRAYVLSALLAP
jgi:hypothetical protein